jgi:hypothetical protein
MEVLDLNVFLSFKINNDTQELDNMTLKKLNDLFGCIDKKNKKGLKKGVNILKNHKIQSKKDHIVNRVNLILNKLSESNIDNLVIEFLENINQIELEEYEEIQKTIYLKIISEINFFKIYLQFLKTIGYLYNKVQNYDLSFFYSIMEVKFKLDYLSYTVPSKFIFVNELEGETKRINNLILIKNFIDTKFISQDLIKECDNIIINQTKFLPDIYYWFNSKSRQLLEDEVKIIKKLLTKDILQREKVLLESLVSKPSTIINKPTVKQINNVVPEVIKTNTIVLECDNIIEEYILIKSLDDIKYFISNRCIDAISKNKFCEQLVDKYFKGNKEVANDIIDLIKVLIKSQTLFKSNLSRGLLIIYNNWKDKMIDYNKPTDKMKTLLLTLKNIGITKGLESLLDSYKIQTIEL